MENKKRKRQRAKNYTELERETLLSHIKPYKSIIDNKKTDGATVEEKKRAWAVVADKYNATSTSGIRTITQLQATYDEMKRKARKNQSDDKVALYKTGGGTFQKKSTALDEMVIGMFPSRFRSLPTTCDSNQETLNSRNNSDYTITINSQPELYDNNENLEQVFTNGESLHLFDILPSSKDNCSKNLSPSIQVVSEARPISPPAMKRTPILKRRRRINEEEDKDKNKKLKYDLEMEILKTMKNKEELDLEIREIIKQKECLALENEKLEHEIKLLKKQKLCLQLQK